jgi:solute carrier family 44 protein 1 (choline transporter-like protein)
LVVVIVYLIFIQVVLLLILLVMRKRIGLVVALFHEAGKCLASIPLLLIQPLWTFVVLFIFFVYWLVVMSFIATIGKLMMM